MIYIYIYTRYIYDIQDIYIHIYEIYNIHMRYKIYMN